MTKAALDFQPTPRPQPRTSPADAERLQQETRDRGFGRTTGSPPVAAPVEASKPAEPRKTAPAAVKLESAPVTATKRGPALKLDVPDEVWTELRFAALSRRVTVRFLVLEALAAKGYGVDLSATPEDGRRIR